jgi:hypothetical protein
LLYDYATGNKKAIPSDVKMLEEAAALIPGMAGLESSSTLSKALALYSSGTLEDNILTGSLPSIQIKDLLTGSKVKKKKAKVNKRKSSKRKSR